MTSSSSNAAWPLVPDPQGAEFRWLHQVALELGQRLPRTLDPNTPSWAIRVSEPRLCEPEASDADDFDWWRVRQPDGAHFRLALSPGLRWNLVTHVFGGTEESNAGAWHAGGRLTDAIVRRVLEQWFRSGGRRAEAEPDGPPAADRGTSLLAVDLTFASADTTYVARLAIERAEAIRRSQNRDGQAGRSPNPKILQRIRRLPVRLVVRTSATEVPASRLMKLQTGDLIRLSEADQAATILLDGQPLMRGRPITVDGRLGIQVERIFFEKLDALAARLTGGAS